MESIQKLRELCQFSRKNCDTWYGKNVCRRCSIYITRVLIFFGISANTVTTIFFILGFLIAGIFLFGTDRINLLGVLLLQFWYILDHVDGELARYYKTESLEGVFFDKLVHHLIHPFIFFCIGLGTRTPLGIFLGMTSGLAIMAIMAIDELKSVLPQKKTALFVEKNQYNQCSERIPLLKKVFSFLHMLCTFPVIMNLFTVAFLLDFFFHSNSSFYILIFYCIVGSVVWIARLIKVLCDKS